jgi:hypothetical protein
MPFISYLHLVQISLNFSKNKAKHRIDKSHSPYISEHKYESTQKYKILCPNLAALHPVCGA